PPAVTAATGVDAFCHAVESYTSIRTNPYTELFAREAIKLIGKNLVRVYQNGADAEAREKMMLAGSYAGVSLMGPMGHFGHGIGTPLGHAFHIPHGIACGITTPQSLEYVAQAMPERIAATAECFGATVPAGATAKEIGKIMKETLIDVFRQINFPLLSSYQMTKQEASDIAVLAVPQIWNSPLPVTEAVVRGMLEEAYDVQY
ncbi:MAG: iron-containing alcohol dehydrogenase, partial [Firmicutes bacterium]|nr:iron-containing alcohol dehydrogenase [Bacillota bacterium]